MSVVGKERRRKSKGIIRGLLVAEAMQGLGEQYLSCEGAQPAGESDVTNFIQVLVRVRPLFDNVKSLDLGAETVVDIQSSQSLAVTTGDGKRSFQCSFDSVLGPFSSQADLYRAVQSGTRSVLDGFNSTIFAYGQTGSGKTYSMYGPPGTETTSNVRTLPFDSESIGVIPRAINEVFALSEDPAVLQVNIYCSFVQIYNEQLFDMLRDASMITPLTIREDSSGEIYVQGLSEYNVKTVADTMQLLRIAEENRTVRQTYMNEFSSRSHSIFQLFVEQKRVAADGGEVGNLLLLRLPLPAIPPSLTNPSSLAPTPGLLACQVQPCRPCGQRKVEYAADDAGRAHPGDDQHQSVAAHSGPLHLILGGSIAGPGGPRAVP